MTIAAQKDLPSITRALEAPLDPKHVRKPDGKFGPKGDYIEGWHAIAEANRIFGHLDWSYRIVTLEKVSLAETDTQKGKQWQAAYTCIVRVDAHGTTREDVGFGSGFAKQIGDAVEGATKEAVTDALKRALRSFGWPFGLALYDKTRENVQSPKPDPQDVFTRMTAAMSGIMELQGLKKFWHQKTVADARGSLPGELRDKLDEAYKAKRNALSQQDAA